MNIFRYEDFVDIYFKSVYTIQDNCQDTDIRIRTEAKAYIMDIFGGSSPKWTSFRDHFYDFKVFSYGHCTEWVYIWRLLNFELFWAA